MSGAFLDATLYPIAKYHYFKNPYPNEDLFNTSGWMNTRIT